MKERLFSQLLHCLDKLNKLPIKTKYLQETKVGRTVNDLRKHDGVVGRAATALITKWKGEVEAKSVEPSDKSKRMLYIDDTENIEPVIRNEYTDSKENGTSGTPNRDSLDETVNKSLPVSCSTDNSSNKSSCSIKSEKEKSSQSGLGKGSKNCDASSSSISGTSAKREGDSSLSSDYYRVKTKNLKRKVCGKSNDKKRRRESDTIDIDSTTGTSFAEALGMLNVASKARKIPNDKSSLSRKASTSSEHKICSPFDKTPSTVTEPDKVQSAFRQPQKQTTQLADEVTTNIISRTSKTKVFSGSKAGLKCKVPTLFEMSIRILQDNIDCEYTIHS